MDALRRQAGKFRDQVAKQQLAVKKHISGNDSEGSDVMCDEDEVQRNQQVDKLCKSTRSKRDFQKEMVKAVETFTVIASKKTEAETKLSEDCGKYGSESTEDDLLGKAVSTYGDARKQIEKELDDLNRLMTSQVLEPLRPMITNTTLDDARHLAQRYAIMKQDADAQTAEVSRRNIRVVESPSQENVAKLHTAVSKVQELKSNVAVLGKEAAEALAAVESEQEAQTFQRLGVLVEGEKNYHVKVAAVLREVETELVSERPQKDASTSVSVSPPSSQAENSSGKTTYFLAEAIHAFVSESEKELSLSVGDYVVVRKGGRKENVKAEVVGSHQNTSRNDTESLRGTSLLEAY